VRVLSVLVLTVFVSCAPLTRNNKTRTSVTHVVVAWLKEPGSEGAQQKLIEASRRFEKIPGVVRVTVGRALPSARPVVDSSFDVAVVITFRDETAAEDV
jgi:hypothetical protein